MKRFNGYLENMEVPMYRGLKEVIKELEENFNKYVDDKDLKRN